MANRDEIQKLKAQLERDLEVIRQFEEIQKRYATNGGGKSLVVEEAIKVNVDSRTSCRIKENVFRMAIPKSENIPDERHYCKCSREFRTTFEPCCRAGEFLNKPFP